ncbi:MAG: alpha/beta hydrolase [Gemmatimonadota bacterium]
MKKWLRRIGIGLGVLVLLVAVSGACYEWIGRRAARRNFPPPGTLVDIGGRRIQIDCRGTGTPIVVLISGLDIGGSTSWSAVHDSLALTTRTCAYSRAGIMWSDAAPGATTAKGVADDLHAALDKAGETGPFVLVGHSLGGPYLMTYTKYYGDQVAGAVMVDASHPDQIDRLGRIVPAAANPALTSMKVAAAFSWAGVVRLATASTPAMPHQDDATVREVAAYSPHSLHGALGEMVALGATLSEAGTFRQLGDRPLVVLTAMKPMTSAELATLEISAETGSEFKAAWKAMQDDEATWSTRSEHHLVDDASHYIQYFRPDVVIQAVRRVVDRVRTGT